MTALLLSDDLFWSSKIVETAKALGRQVVRAKTVDELERLARQQAPQLVILDLCIYQIDAADVARRVCAIAPEARLVGFGRHTDVEGLERARAAGCDPVLVRSALQARLPETLAEWLEVGSPGASSPS